MGWGHMFMGAGICTYNFPPPLHETPVWLGLGMSSKMERVRG